jgi:murein DD-endopeptidase MepM/ murein hydrolase activator NlpD
VLAVIALASAGSPATPAGFGGGGVDLNNHYDCIPADERRRIEEKIAQFSASVRQPHLSTSMGPAPYPFVPVAGTAWFDRFILNFVDRDPTAGILDWDCSGFTYDGHRGHDIMLRSFGEQDIGVPVFAALDGTVTASHDGEFDRNTSAQGQPANYVVLFHGGTHYTWYYHLRRNSVAVTNGQSVRAGQQLGLAASSGSSTAPHLHFETRHNGAVYEPSKGQCEPGTSGWVNQLAIPRHTWIEDFGMHASGISATNFFPNDPPRIGTFVSTGAAQPIGAWYTVHNQPANSTWRARYLRPNGTLLRDSGTQAFNNPFYRWGNWRFFYFLNPDIAGTWTLEFSLNGQVMVNAPFTVLDAGSVPANRPPNPVTAALDPIWPSTNDVVFCRVNGSLLADPDYDLVRFRFEWMINDVRVRDVTNAAYSDALQRGLARAGDVITCRVTPSDGQTFGAPSTAQTITAGGGPRLSIAPQNDRAVLSWPTSVVQYSLQSSTNFASTNAWARSPATPAIVAGHYWLTNTFETAPKAFRLVWP